MFSEDEPAVGRLDKDEVGPADSSSSLRLRRALGPAAAVAPTTLPAPTGLNPFPFSALLARGAMDDVVSPVPAAAAAEAEGAGIPDGLSGEEKSRGRREGLRLGALIPADGLESIMHPPPGAASCGAMRVAMGERAGVSADIMVVRGGRGAWDEGGAVTVVFDLLLLLLMMLPTMLLCRCH